MQIVFIIAGLLIGSILGRHGGWLYGALAGFAIGAWIDTDNKVKKLQEELTNLKNRVQSYSEVKPEAATEAATEHAAASATAKAVVDKPETTVTNEPIAVQTPVETKPIEKPADTDFSHMKNELERSLLTLIVFLNDDFQGGGTRFETATVTPRAGHLD